MRSALFKACDGTPLQSMRRSDPCGHKFWPGAVNMCRSKDDISIGIKAPIAAATTTMAVLQKRREQNLAIIVFSVHKIYTFMARQLVTTKYM
mmetsp:Transcript_322/g.781  ORF Transcript_322/g.781 Transcript_322/m.781 type:complete len:92 (-) Transcript_322:103-378(-)